MFGAMGGACHATSMLFLSQAAAQSDLANTLGLKSLIGEVRGCRTVRKADMIHNNYQPDISVDPQTYEVKADGVLLTCEPAEELPMAQRYFLF